MTSTSIAWLASAPVAVDRIPIGERPVRLEEIARYWGDSSTLFPMSWLLVACGLATMLLAIAAYIRWRRRRNDRPRDSDLFHGFTTEAGLTLRERWLLHRVARHRRLPSALTLLACPATFDRHTHAYAAERGDGQGDQLDRRFVGIRQRLFRGASRA